MPYGLEIKKHRRAQDSFKEKGYERNFPIIRDHRGKDNERQITPPRMINKIAPSVDHWCKRLDTEGLYNPIKI